jgi:hypothetical protein
MAMTRIFWRFAAAGGSQEAISLNSCVSMNTDRARALFIGRQQENSMTTFRLDDSSRWSKKYCIPGTPEEAVNDEWLASHKRKRDLLGRRPDMPRTICEYTTAASPAPSENHGRDSRIVRGNLIFTTRGCAACRHGSHPVNDRDVAEAVERLRSRRVDR